MARAALLWSLDDVEAAAGVSRRTVLRLEQGEPVRIKNHQAIRRAFEAAGVRFIDGGEAVGVTAPPHAGS